MDHCLGCGNPILGKPRVVKVNGVAYPFHAATLFRDCFNEFRKEQVRNQPQLQLARRE